MPTYRVTYRTHAAAVVTVQADSPQAALDASWDQLEETLCHQCSRHIDLGDFEPAGNDELGDLAAVTLDV